MKKNYVLGIVLFFSIQLSFSQFTDDMEWDAGDCPSHWTTFTGPGDCPIVVSGGHTGNQSAYIDGNGVTDNLLDLGSKIFGEWRLQFWMFIPVGKEGYFNIQGEVPVTTGEFVVGNIYFNQDASSPGQGIIDDSALGDVTFNFPHDQWFRITMNFDLTSGMANATWHLWIDDIEVIPIGTSFTNEAGDIPTSLGGLDFFSVSANTEFYFDDFCYYEPFPVSGCFIAGIDEFGNNSFQMFPNPTQNKLFVESVEEISKINVYSQLGQLVIDKEFTNEIDVSSLANGLYFVEVETSFGNGIQKFIKN
ncbi:MAG: hypothetical protein CMC14_08175 [Flavobacteriaceae bacterium]|nr:hypothetical protein [Flavobacteriaceae bacterium]|tara:strand:+ start:32740 stop:33654 length:915 start_codon:yes stop_codon:yes gene_type:complete